MSPFHWAPLAHGRLRVVSFRLVIALTLSGMLVASSGSGVVAGGSGPSAGSPAGVTVAAHVPRSAYPSGALARVTLTVRNASPAAITVTAVCHGQNPRADVLGRAGRVVYPPALHFPPHANGACELGSGMRLAPGKGMRTQMYVILRGATLRPQVELTLPSGAHSRIAGKPLRVRLTPGRPPPVSLSSGPRITATLSRPPGASGRPLYVGWFRCTVAEFAPARPVLDTWTPVSPHNLRPQPHSPDCIHLLEWHAVVGWLNYPVASINYRRG